MKTTIKTTTGQTAKTIATIFVACGLIFSSCKKGDTGPAGATGATGNANVQEMTFTNQGFAYVAANSDYEINLNVTALNQNVLDKGVVAVYLQSTSTTTAWATLPTTIGGVTINVAYALNQVQLSDNAASSGLFNVKVVVIPPAMVKPNVNTHNYAEVKAAYNL